MTFYSIMLISGFIVMILDAFIGSFVLMGLGGAAILSGAIAWGMELSLVHVSLVYIILASIFVYSALRFKDKEHHGPSIHQKIQESERGSIVEVLSQQPLRVKYRGIPYDAKIEGIHNIQNIQRVRVLREEGLFVIVETIQEES